MEGRLGRPVELQQGHDRARRPGRRAARTGGRRGDRAGQGFDLPAVVDRRRDDQPAEPLQGDHLRDR
eukprot:5253137-Alexandrium_andersonii.AAC.1